ARDAVLRLVRQPGAPPKSPTLRSDIQATALESTRVFLESRPHDRGVRLDAARVYRAIANVGRTVGKFEGPREMYQKASTLLDQLRAEYPDDPVIAEEQALNIIDTGELWLMNGQPARSRSFFEGVRDDLDALGGRLTGTQERAKALALLDLATALNE